MRRQTVQDVPQLSMPFAGAPTAAATRIAKAEAPRPNHPEIPPELAIRALQPPAAIQRTPDVITQRSLRAEVIGPRSLPVCELGGFDARLLARLPAPLTVSCALTDPAGRVRSFLLTTALADFETACALKLAALHGADWVSLCDGAERGRGAVSTLLDGLQRRMLNPAWAFSTWFAMGESYVAREPDPRRPWSVDAVLRAYGARLLDVAASVPSDRAGLMALVAVSDEPRTHELALEASA